MRALVIICLLALPWSQGLAQMVSSSADEADVLFQLGNQAYQGERYQEALSHYLASHRLAPNRNVMFNIARCYERLRQYVEACRYYRAFDGPDLTGEERRALDEVLSRVRPNVALLDLSSDPGGATIYINRRDLGSYGVTPQVLVLAPGEYRIILERPGFHPYLKEGVVLAPGVQERLHARLGRVLGRLRVWGEPLGAWVKVDDPVGGAGGMVPLELDVSPGERRVMVTREGYVSQEAVVRVEAGGQASVEVRLVPQTGTLVVQSEEHDALILVDGRPAGFTPAVIDGLTVGQHRITVAQEGFHVFERDVEVKADERVLVEVANLTVMDDVAAASRVSESVRDAPASVTLISRREINAFGHATVAEALQGERGIYLSDDRTYQSMGLRGYSPFGQYGNRLLVQLDGHTLNDDWIGSSYVEYDLLSHLDPLDRIELIRGPGSALYGTGAFLGVLNLVSPARWREEVVRAGVSMAGPGVFRAYASAGSPLWPDGGAWVSGGGIYGQGGDFYSPARVGSAEAPDGLAHNVGGFTAGGLMGKIFWRDLTLEGYAQQRDKQISTGAFQTIFGDPRARTEDLRAFVELRYEPRFGEIFHILGRAYYDHSGYGGRFPYADEELGLVKETYSGDWGGVEVRGLYTPFQGLRVTLGSGYEMHLSNPARGWTEGDEEPYFEEEHPYHLMSAYVVSDYAPLDWLAASAGLRLDAWWIEGLLDPQGERENRFLYSLNPRLGLIFHPTREGTLKVLAGRAFRAPSIYELTYWDSGVTQVPSPDLEPEVIYTAEIEYSHGLPAGFRVVGTVFVNSILSLIEQVGEGTLLDPFHYRNQGEILWTMGGEFEVRREFRRGWMMGVQYSYQRTRLSDILSGREPPNAPTHMAGGKMILPLAGRALQLASRLLVESGRLDREGGRGDPALVWDVTLSGEIKALHLRYAAGVRNLLDWRYGYPVSSEILDGVLEQRGISFMADLSFAY